MNRSNALSSNGQGTTVASWIVIGTVGSSSGLAL